MSVNLSQRAFDANTVELMDIAETTSAELTSDLENLHQLNRWFGSHRLFRHYLTKLIPNNSTQHFLDLCTGSGDIPRLIVDWCRKRGVQVTIDAWDFQPATLSIAQGLSTSYPEISWHCGDVRQLETNKTYQGVFCSLALHHFSESDALQILRTMNKAAQNFALVADLERTRLTWLGVRFITSTVFREPMTVHDALLSVRRAFSFQEFANLAENAGWQHPRHRRFLYGRQALLLTKPPPQT